MKKQYEIIYGIQTIYELIKYKYDIIYEIYILSEDMESFKHQYIIDILRKRKINIFYVNKIKILKILKKDVVNINEINHQNIIAIIKKEIFLSLDALLKKIKEEIRLNEEKEITLLTLNKIKDPQNLGSIIRSSSCFNVMSIILLSKNSVKLTSAVKKISCGASFAMSLTMVNNLSNAIIKLKELKFSIIGLTEKGSVNIKNLKTNRLKLILLGNEKNGINNILLKQCDYKAKILIKKNISSLNVAIAAAIALYELSFN